MKSKEQILGEHLPQINDSINYSTLFTKIYSAMEEYANQALSGCKGGWVKASEDDMIDMGRKYWRDGYKVPIPAGTAYNLIKQGLYVEWLDESSPCQCGKYREALDKIIEMKREPNETTDTYAFNRCWHIATEALK